MFQFVSSQSECLKAMCFDLSDKNECIGQFLLVLVPT